MSFRNLLRTGSCLDLDYIHHTLSVEGKGNPLHYKKIIKDPSALTGKASYFTKDDLKQDHYEVLSASSRIPVACKPYPVEGITYYDGGISDPMPIERALITKEDKSILVMTRPRDELRDPKDNRRPAKMLRRSHPFAASDLLCRAQKTCQSEGTGETGTLPDLGSAFHLRDEDADQRQESAGCHRMTDTPRHPVASVTGTTGKASGG